MGEGLDMVVVPEARHGAVGKVNGDLGVCGRMLEGGGDSWGGWTIPVRYQLCPRGPAYLAHKTWWKAECPFRRSSYRSV